MATRGETAEKLWTATFVLLTLVQTMDLLLFHTITPVIAKFTIEQGAALAASGLAASVFSLAAIFARPISGLLADRLGRRSIVLSSIAVSVVMQVGYAFTPGFVSLLAMRVVHGFFYALFGTAISAMALASLPKSRKNEGMGWFGASYVVAAIIGPAMGVALSDTFGFTTMFLVTAAIAAASFPLAAIATAGAPSPVQSRRGKGASCDTDEARSQRSATVGQGAASQNGEAALADQGPAPQSTEAGLVNQSPSLQNAEANSAGRSERKRFRLPALRDLVSVQCIPLAGIAMCFMAIWGMIASYIVLVGEARGVDNIALFFVVNSATLFATRPAIGKITDRHGLSKLILPAIAIETCALLGICFAQQLWLFLLAAFVKAFGSGGVLPSIQAECGRLETPERAGVAMSTYLLASDIGYAVGPLIGGVLANAVGYDLMLFGSFPIVALAFAIYLVWHGRRKI